MLLQHDDAFGNAHQVFGADFDEFSAGIGFENVGHSLVAEAAGCKVASAMYGSDFVTDDRDVLDRGVLNVRAVDADKNVLANDVAFAVAMAYADEVQVDRTVHRRACVRFNQRERGSHAGKFVERGGNSVQTLTKNGVVSAA